MASVFEKPEGQKFENTVIKDRLYPATFKAFKLYTRTNKKTGEEESRIRWGFDVQTKKGVVELSGFTSTKWGYEEKPSKSREWMAALQGKRASDSDISEDIDAQIGKRCMVKTVTLGQGDEASSIIDCVYPPDDEDDDEDTASPEPKELDDDINF